MQDIMIYIKSMTKQAPRSETHSDSTRTQPIPAAPAGIALVALAGSTILDAASVVAAVGCSPSVVAATGLAAAAVVVG